MCGKFLVRLCSIFFLQKVFSFFKIIKFLKFLLGDFNKSNSLFNAKKWLTTLVGKHSFKYREKKNYNILKNSEQFNKNLMKI